MLQPHTPSLSPTPRRQRGFGMVEMVVVIAAALVLMVVAITFTQGVSRTAQRKQLTDQQSRDMAQIARATKQYIAANPGAFALNTNVPIAVGALVTGGFLPTGFGDRAGTGAALTPFGQPYVIVARKIKDGDPATAVVTESGSALPEKLPGIGVENEANAVTGLKRDIAAQTNQNYQTVTGLIPAGTRTAQGTGGAFTKDLTAYFTAGFTQAAPVAFVNFKDLDPDDNIGTDPTAGTPGEKVYEGCQIYTLDVGTGTVSGNYYPGWDRRSTYRPIMGNFAGECAAPPEADTCPLGPGRHYEASAIVSNCQSGAVTPIGVGYFTNNMADEPRPAASGNCPTEQPCFDNYQTGTITMNQVTVVRGFCRSDVWSHGNLIHSPTGGTGVNQSFAGACCSYHWSKPKTTCP